MNIPLWAFSVLLIIATVFGGVMGFAGAALAFKGLIDEREK